MSDAPLHIGHPDQDPATDDTCGCCVGTTLSTLQPIYNRPNLTALRYRVGDHGQFKASMLAGLASSSHPALLGLGTRDDDDFSIALIDAWAVVCDVLSFYQERHANEAFIQTALERLSINEIARLIGYRLHPGSAAETSLAILMEDPPGAEADVASLTVPVGTRVQSQPGPDEEPQTFETLEDLEARVAWNALHPRQSRGVTLAAGARGTWLVGQAPGLQPGDMILVVHPQRGMPGSPGFNVNSNLWDMKRLVAVRANPDLDQTWIAWEGSLRAVSPAGETEPVHRIYTLRKQGALFGHNAPHPLVLTTEARAGFGFTGQTPPTNSPSTITGDSGNPGDWDFAASVVDGFIPLDAVYKEYVEDSWAVLTTPGGTPELYRVATAATDATARFAISAKATRINPDRFGWVAAFAGDYRRVSVFGASEELQLAETPITDFVAGTDIELGNVVEDLPEKRALQVTGHRAQVVVAVNSIQALQEDGALHSYPRDARLTLMAPPWKFPMLPTLGFWLFTGPDDALALTLAFDTFFQTVTADKDSPTQTEAAILDRVEIVDPRHSRLVLTQALSAAYDSATLVINGNVARASHGETVSDILGGGDPGRPFQTVTLKQGPVTHLVAPTENGVESSLTLRIDQVEWSEVANLYGRAATERVFATSLSDLGETTLHFGDGISGARPPAGQDNIQGEYRKGLGLAGNVRAGQLMMPLDRPLGLKEVTNPMPATGGADAEASKDARRNAPIYTLTLGRVVSVTDYRDFALGYPGIAKADARWIWQGESRRIVVTVAGDDGAAVPRNGPVHDALLAAYRTYGDPLVTFELLSYQQATFRIGLKIAVDSGYDPELVLPQVETTLRAAYAFERRDFAQPVALSDAAATAHSVPGVIAVDIDRLYRDQAPQDTVTDHMLLQSLTGRPAANDTLLPAEILTLSPDPFDSLEVME